MGGDVAGWIEAFSYPAVIFLLMGTGLGLPLSEELVMLTAGLVVAQGAAQLWPMMAVAWLGLVASDTLLYTLGNKLGRRVLDRPRFRKLLTPGRVAWIEAHFERRGVLTVFVARFLPGVRAPTFLVAGMSRFPRARFVIADAIAAMVTAPLLVYLGYRFGLSALAQVQRFGQWALLGAIAVAVGAVLVTWWRRRRTARALSNDVARWQGGP